MSTGSGRVRSLDIVVDLLLASTHHATWMREPRLRYFTYMLELLAGIPRFLEKALFSMGCGDRGRRYSPHRLFLHTLSQGDGPATTSLTHLLGEVVRVIQSSV